MPNYMRHSSLVWKVKKRWSNFIESIWYGKHPFRLLLYPFSLVYQFVIAVRRFVLEYHQRGCAVPIIVVGNLTIGGVGKTPLVVALIQYFQAQGIRVGVVSRGYGSHAKHYPWEVDASSSATTVGDEPLLIYSRTHCPVVIAPRRMDAVTYLINKYQSQVIISDDGLQHYAMARAIEMVVIDGIRWVGNGLCLPAGPLREPIKRLKGVDFIVVNGEAIEDTYSMRLVPGKVKKIKTGEEHTLQSLEKPIAAVAGIGHPQRFFNTLTELGVIFTAYSFTDHYPFKAKDLQLPEKTIVMTEKDAVRCTSFATNKLYYLPVEAEVDDAFWRALSSHKLLQGYFKK